MDGISRLGSTGGIDDWGRVGAGKAPEGFGGVLRQAIERVQNLEAESETEIRRLLSGESEDVHKVALAGQKADLAFLLLLETRNKVVQAYQEIMRIQV